MPPSRTPREAVAKLRAQAVDMDLSEALEAWLAPRVAALEAAGLLDKPMRPWKHYYYRYEPPEESPDA